MFEKCQHARTASLFPPYCVDFPCNTQSIAASNRLVWRKNPSLLGKFPIFKQGLVARRKFRPATQILRAGNSAILNRYASPRNGGPGVSGPMGTKCPSAASPGDPLVTFPSLGKSLAARRRRNPPATNATIPSSPPHPSRLRRATFPPRGKA